MREELFEGKAREYREAARILRELADEGEFPDLVRRVLVGGAEDCDFGREEWEALADQFHQQRRKR